jgi:hypothetical protein
MLYFEHFRFFLYSIRYKTFETMFDTQAGSPRLSHTLIWSDPQYHFWDRAMQTIHFRVSTHRKFSAHFSFNFIVTLTMPTIFGFFQACSSHPESHGAILVFGGTIRALATRQNPKISLTSSLRHRLLGSRCARQHVTAW